MLKERLQTADKMHRPWKQTVTEFLQNYRATQHATTGATPFRLLRHKKIRTKLYVLLSHTTSNNTQVEETVKQKQQKSKKYTDGKVSAKVLMF